MASFEPILDFSFTISTQSGYGSLNTKDQGGGTFLAIAGSLTNTAGADPGTFALYPGGPGVTTSPQGAFNYDDLVFPTANPPLDVDALLFRDAAATTEINIWGNSANNYSWYDHTSAGYGTQLTSNGTFTVNIAPGGGQTYPAKYVYDVTAAPSCSNDYVAIGVAATPASGGQANIVGYNNLYSTQGGAAGPLCGTAGPSVKFAYASGTGQVPASLTLSLDGRSLAYIENLTSGSSYFHSLKIGTTGSQGTSATAAVVPGAGNNAVDQRVLLSPDGGVTNQSSTNAPFIAYTGNDANDVAYATTYSWSGAGTGTGYLYKINNVFSASAPAIVWSVPINAVPSAPVYDPTSNKVFFTDSNGRIDYVVDNGASGTLTYGSVIATGTTSLNPVTIDTTSQKVFACFNTNGSNAIVAQTTTTLSGTTTVTVGLAGPKYYTGPYGIEFNNAYYGGAGVPLLYVVGTGTGSTPTLYGIPFSGGVITSTGVTSTALATGAADASAPTEFYNPTLAKDFLFVGVTNHCAATTAGGTAGCVMSLDITSGFPTVNAATTALAATAGTSGIVVDNDSNQSQASSIYYATKTGTSLVKATQAALN